MRALITAFWTDDSGATAIEYALIASIVSIGAVATISQIPGILETMFGHVAAGFGN